MGRTEASYLEFYAGDISIRSIRNYGGTIVLVRQ
jgi:hypothetical protein